MHKPLQGNQTPRFLIAPDADYTDGPTCGELADAYGLTPDPWQQTVLDNWLACDEQHNYAADTCGLSVPRQNGKNGVLEMIELDKLTMQHRKILHTAHEVKCLDVDTPILTVDGWKTMGELTDDDRVYDNEGKPVSLIAHPIQHDNPCYRITFDDGQQIVADDGHLWGVDYKPQWGEPRYRELTTQQMVDEGIIFERKMGSRTRRDYKFRTRLPKPLQLPEASLPYDPYVFGYWLGDGHKGAGTISCGVEDVAYLTAQLDCRGIEYSMHTDKRTGVHYVTPKGLRRVVRNLGLIDNKEIPECYALSSVEQRRQLLAGLMDSDGTSTNGQCQIGMMNAGLIAQILSLVRSLGYKATFRTVTAKCRGVVAGTCFRVQFRAYRGESPFLMPRKTERLAEKRSRKVTRACYNAIVSIEPVETRPTRCITVLNDSKLYCVGTGFIVTHNTCRKAFMRLKSFFEQPEKYPELAEMVKYIRATNGQEAIQLWRYDEYGDRVDGGSIEFIARSKSSGRGFTVDDVVCDEAQEMTDEQFEVLRSTNSAAPSGNPQLIMTGTPTPPSSPGTVFARTRKNAIAGNSKRTCWIEWSVPEIGDVRDMSRVEATNPALGYRLQESVIDSELNSMEPDGFARERLGWWTDGANNALISSEEWDALAIGADEVPDDQPPNKKAFGVKFTPDGSKVAVAVAVLQPDGSVHVELVDNGYRLSTSGVRWITDFLEERQHSTAAVAIDGRSGMSVLVDQLNKRHYPAKAIMLPGTNGVIAACTMLLEAVHEKTLTHYGQQQLTESAVKSQRREIGNQGGWGFDGDDCAPIEAACLAYWAVRTTKRRPGRKARML